MKKEKSSKIICLRLLNINLLDSQQTFVLGGEKFKHSNSFSHSKEDWFNFCSDCMTRKSLQSYLRESLHIRMH
jgi:hypothetical protein